MRNRYDKKKDLFYCTVSAACSRSVQGSGTLIGWKASESNKNLVQELIAQFYLFTNSHFS